LLQHNELAQQVLLLSKWSDPGDSAGIYSHWVLRQVHSCEKQPSDQWRTT